MRIEWSALALDDIDDIRHYIAKDSPSYASDFVEWIFASSERLAEFPMSGRAVPEADDRNIREILVRSWRVMYRIETDRLLMLAVMHERRDLGGMIGKPWDT